MRKWLRWLLFGIGGLFGLWLLYIVFNFLFLDFFVNLWWFDSLDLRGYFLMRLVYRYLIFALVLLLFFLIFFLNFWYASRYIGFITDDPACALNDTENEKQEKGRIRRLAALFRSGSMRVYTPLSFVLALPIAIPFYKQWEMGLLFLFGQRTGVRDVDFGLDISFYLFGYPFYKLLEKELLAVFLLLFLFLLVLYWLEKRILCKSDQTLPKGARMHLVIIAVITVLVQAWGLSLDLIDLLNVTIHEPLFSGPGFVEMWVTRPLIILTVLTFTGTGIALIFFFYNRKGMKTALVFLALLLIVIGLRSTPMLTNMLDRYIVKPNELEREAPYMAGSIEATLAGYGLDNVRREEFSIGSGIKLLRSNEANETLPNVPVWDRELLDDVYKQLQGFRTYYAFPNVDVDRYTVAGTFQQVNLAAREINLADLPPSAQNWINRHMQYTHGYGVVMTPAAQGGDEPMQWFLRDIPLQSEFGIDIKQPRIYYGEEHYEYALVPNDLGEIDHPQIGTEAKINYDGRGGIPINSMLRKMLFSIYFKEKDLFFTTKITRDTRLLLRRNIIDMVQRITPFIDLDSDPYIVATPEGLYWILDAYTLSPNYPNAHIYKGGIHGPTFPGKTFNYIRNAIKIVVDAYHGEINYYIADPKDPIANAYRRIYPGLLKPMEEMPKRIRKQVRYPRDIFTIQMRIYAKYHQTDTSQFYQDEDTWEFARMSMGDIRPYYVTMHPADETDIGFYLISPMSPIGRENLRALAAVKCDGDQYGQIVIYSFPRGRQVYGPSQIEALVNSDGEIAQQITLWDQIGSSVRLGRMVLLPVGDQIIYIQPIYLIAERQPRIPELKRIIVSQGEMVAMARTIEGALEELEARLEERLRIREQRYKKVRNQQNQGS